MHLQCIFKMTCNIIYEGSNSFEIKLIKEFQIVKGPLIVDNLIASKVDDYKIPFFLSIINLRSWILGS